MLTGNRVASEPRQLGVRNGMQSPCARVEEDILPTERSGFDSNESSQFYKDLFRQTEMCALWLDTKGAVCAITSAAAGVFGYQPEQLIGTLASALLGTECFEQKLLGPFEKALTGKKSSFDFALGNAKTSRIQRNKSKQAGLALRWITKPYQFENGNTGVFCSFTDISELHFSQLLQARQASQLDDFIHASSDWFWELDSELSFSWISKKIEAIYGIKVENYIGRKRTQISADMEEAKKWEEHTALLTARLPFQNFEYKLKFDDNVIRWARISGIPIYNDTGEFQGYRGIASDITELKRLEEETQKVQQQLLLAMEHFPGGLILYDANDTILHFNKQCKKILEPLQIENLQGMARKEFLLAQARNSWVPEAEGREESWVVEMLSESGTTPRMLQRNKRWYQTSRTDLPGGAWLQSLIDVTDKRELDLKIAEERNLLRSIIDNISDKIYAKDVEGRFIVANEAVRVFFGAAEESDLLGTTDFDHYPEERAAGFFATEMKVIKEEYIELDQVDMHNDKEDGSEVWFSTNKVPLKDTSGEIVGVVGFGRNITQQVELTSEVQESHQRFRDFAETAADWFWECDENLNICFLSERFADIVGCSLGDAIQQPLIELVASALPDPIKFDKFKQATEQRAAFADLELTYGDSPASQTLFLFSGKPLYELDGKFQGYRGIGRDITKQTRLQTQLSYQATHDALTNLPNRQAFEHQLDTVLEQSRLSKQSSVLGYIDLDQFKIVNDTAGHRAGDVLLCQIAKLIRAKLRDCDMVARLGGDEFGLIFEGVNIEEGAAIAESLIADLQDFRFTWGERVFIIGASIGLVELTAYTQDTVEVLSNADVACYAAKDLGRNRVQVFSPENGQLEKNQNEILAAARITNALENDLFYLYMQPIVLTHSQNLEAHHYEALLRMSDEKGNMIPPGTFIPAAERFGLMKSIDRWVIKNVLAKFPKVFGPHSNCGVTINLSGDSMTDATLFGFVREHLELNKIDPARVCFEITETAVVNNFALASEFINDIRGLGCCFALDDFGSGLCSFAYLKHFKVDYLKIDGCFVRDILDDESDRAMVTAINQIGHVMGIKTIAEFVENHEILEVLREMNVDYVQGYGIGKPVPLEADNLQLKFAA